VIALNQDVSPFLLDSMQSQSKYVWLAANGI
jgi:hypothetical protein